MKDSTEEHDYLLRAEEIGLTSLELKYAAGGARLVLQNDGQPEIVWDRENFSFSEAVTYYEFTIDKLLKAGL